MKDQKLHAFSQNWKCKCIKNTNATFFGSEEVWGNVVEIVTNKKQ